MVLRVASELAFAGRFDGRADEGRGPCLSWATWKRRARIVG